MIPNSQELEAIAERSEGQLSEVSFAALLCALWMDERTALPTKEQVYQTIEGTITHFELVMANRGFEVPCEESYAAIEAPNGELGFYVVGDGSNVAYRARCRPPSFVHFALFPHLIRGHTLSDVVAVLGSLNIIAAELDR